MSLNIDRYLSEIARNNISYQWEDIPAGNVLRFDANTLPSPPDSLNNFLEQMKSDCPINEYSDPNYKKLKKLIAGYEGVSQTMITITNSADEAIDVLAKTFLNPGDYFITTPPTYEMFEIQCGINRGENLPIPLVGGNFTVNEEKIVSGSKENKVKITFLVNPNNPTASIIPQDSIENIIKNSDSIVVVDEVYREFYGKSVVSLLGKYKNLVILRSFSKFAALAGARIGYLIADKKLAERFNAIRMPMGVSYLSYKLAEFVLEKDRQWMSEQVQMIVGERERLTGELTKMGFYVYPSYTNFLLVKIGNYASKVCGSLKKKRIIIRNLSGRKYLSDCVRITVRSRRENNQLIRAIKEIL